jgi:hypothetical protein
MSLTVYLAVVVPDSRGKLEARLDSQTTLMGTHDGLCQWRHALSP